MCDPKSYYQCVQGSMLNYVKNNEASKCNCPRRCRRLMYQETISQSKLAISAASYMKRYLNIQATVNDIINDYCLVEVCYLADIVLLPLD